MTGWGRGAGAAGGRGPDVGGAVGRACIAGPSAALASIDSARAAADRSACFSRPSIVPSAALSWEVTQSIVGGADATGERCVAGQWRVCVGTVRTHTSLGDDRAGRGGAEALFFGGERVGENKIVRWEKHTRASFKNPARLPDAASHTRQPNGSPTSRRRHPGRRAAGGNAVDTERGIARGAGRARTRRAAGRRAGGVWRGCRGESVV